jgi:hypothetical protein
MKEDELTLRITGKGDGTISPSSIAKVMRGLTIILNQVDASVAASTRPTLEWHIYAISMNSPMESRWFPTTDNDVDYGKQVLSFSLTGIDQIGHRADAIPPHFTSRSLNAARLVAQTLGRDVAAVDLESPYTIPTSFVANVAKNVHTIAKHRIGERVERSSFRGYLKSMSIRNSQVFHIEDHVYGYITCTFDGDLLDSLKSGLFSERVMVSGRTRFTADNRPISVHVDHIERLKLRSELPQFSDLERIVLKQRRGSAGDVTGIFNGR